MLTRLASTGSLRRVATAHTLTRTLHAHAYRQAPKDKNATNMTPTPATPTVSSMPIGTGASSKNDLSKLDLSDEATRDRIISEARRRRRANLWLVSLLTGTAAFWTTKRYYEAQSLGKEKLAQGSEELEREKMKLQEMIQQRERRREMIKAKLEEIAPINGATNATAAGNSTPTPTTPTPVPTSFLTAAALDLRRTLQLVEPDAAVELTPGTTAQITAAAAAAAATAATNEPKKPQRRTAVIM